MEEIKKFLKQIHPFSELSRDELREVSESADIGYYRKDAEIITPSDFGKSLYVVIKGRVIESSSSGELISIFEEGSSFDSSSLLNSSCNNTFTVDEELLCYEIPKKNFIELINNSTAFKNYFVEGVATKIQNLKERDRNSTLSTFMLSKVSNIFLHKTTIVTEDTPIIEAIEKQEEDNSTCILVESGESLLIVTDSDIRKSLLNRNFSVEDRISTIATSSVLEVDHNDFLFSAMIKLVRHNIKRLIVKKDGEIIGILEQIDILSHFSNHSYLVAVQIEKAKSVEELREVSSGLLRLIRSLYEKGVKVRHSTKLISELNKKIYEKLFRLLFSPELQKVTTLYIMGSEGRREQILKTDQDNGIILYDNSYRDEVERVAKLFTKELINLGYPPCDGNIMVSNPYWIETEEGLNRRISKFLEKPDPSALMELAILFDGEVVVGDSESLQRVKSHLMEEMSRNRFALDSFAGAIQMFDTPLSLFGNFAVDHSHSDELDIKKGGIFAIVHGVRSLAIENRVYETNSVERVKKLNDIGVINRELAEELIEAFDTLLTVRLTGRLRKIDKGRSPDNYINPEKLSLLQRDLLRESFKIVNRFKKFLVYHFKLDRVG